MTKPDPNLRDAHPEARLPDMSPELLKLCSAYERLKTAGEACNTHAPPYAGPAWDAKKQAYAKARDELFALFEQIKGNAK